jgi:hypothetical protein
VAPGRVPVEPENVTTGLVTAEVLGDGDAVADGVGVLVAEILGLGDGVAAIAAAPH